MSGMDLKRRRVVQGLGAGLLLPALGAPAVIASPRARPKLTDGVQSGDVQGDRALVWSRTDRPARMIVEWDTRSVFSEPRRLSRRSPTSASTTPRASTCVACQPTSRSSTGCASRMPATAA